jgi:hypothetical protein
MSVAKSMRAQTVENRTPEWAERLTDRPEMDTGARWRTESESFGLVGAAGEDEIDTADGEIEGGVAAEAAAGAGDDGDFAGHECGCCVCHWKFLSGAGAWDSAVRCMRDGYLDYLQNEV